MAIEADTTIRTHSGSMVTMIPKSLYTESQSPFRSKKFRELIEKFRKHGSYGSMKAKIRILKKGEKAPKDGYLVMP